LQPTSRFISATINIEPTNIKAWYSVHRMVSQPVLGAAIAVGIALFVAFTLLMYRYHKQRRMLNELFDAERRVENIPLVTTNLASKERRPGQSVCTKMQVSAFFIHSVSFHLLWRVRYAWSDVCLCALLDGLGTNALFILSNGKCKNTNINTAFKNTNTIQQYTKPKTIDKNQDYNTSGIYKFTCNTCKMSCIGQTSRNLNQRYREHIRYIRNNDPQSAYAQHILQNLHEYGSITYTMSLLKPIHKTSILIPYEQLFIQTFHHNRSLITEQGTDEQNPLFQLAIDTMLTSAATWK
jgi:hypothetical protein